MLRINAAWIMEIYADLIVLGSFDEVYTSQYDKAYEALDALVNKSLYAGSLKSSTRPTSELLEIIRHAFEASTEGNADPDFLGIKILEEEAVKVRRKWYEVRPILIAEMGVQPTYFVSPVASYDTDRLLDDGLSLFPASLSLKVPEASEDGRMAGKSIIYQMPMACAFHVFRMLELVTRKYWLTVSPDSKKKKPTLGWIAAEIDSKKLADEALIYSLKNLTNLYRNPVLHPEKNLSQQGAITLLGLVNSVLEPMLSEIDGSEEAL